VHIKYGPVVDFAPTGDYEADVRALSQRLLDFCEDLIRRQPEYWLWSYKRWKHCPTTDLTGFPFYAHHTKT
jgi:lauroyl/myristoyl acyltransferase